jgi:TolB-like protein/phage shock protein PspC (stress-responsive transcriptional regulator)
VDEFLQRLKQRKIVQWTLAYLAASFAVIQVLDVIAQRFGWSEAVMRIVIVVLGVGFFLAIVVAWYHGERGAQRVSGMELLILALLLAIGGVAVSQFAPSAPPPAVALVPAAPSISPKSIAILPFADLSPAHDQEYFSDGIAEELQSALTRLRDLKVAGRSSSRYYKGRNEDLRAIGKALGVANVLEGSVRKQGDRVRITAQLVRTDDDFRVWSDNYDGDLSDVFALQERIARAITDKLDVTLQGDQQKAIVPVATSSPEAYALYLQASDVFNRRDGAHFFEAIAQLERALELDPKFARAHARLASLLAVATNYAKYDFAASMASAEDHARRATELDPSLAEPHAALGQALLRQRRFAESLDAMERAGALDAADETAIFWYAANLSILGYVRRGEGLLDRVLTIDPRLPTALHWRGLLYAYAGDIANAERLLRRSAEVKLAFAGMGLSLVAASRGQTDEAADELAAGFKPIQLDLSDAELRILARGIVGDAAARTAALALIDDYLRRPQTSNGVMAYALIVLGEPARALAITQERASPNDSTYQIALWTPYGLQARLLPQFSDYVRKVGFAAVWDRYGEPDLCRKQPSGEYACR